jgi:DNA-binding transcriptional MerR regulator
MIEDEWGGGKVYTVKQLSNLAGVTVRTLHYYDEIGLLNPSSVGENSYRYYDEEALFRLQQILFFKEMDLELLQIQEILDNPAFDSLDALQAHRQALQARVRRLNRLIQTVDHTIRHLAGEVEMSKNQIFEGFTEAQQAEYEKQAMEMYDPEVVRASSRRWKSYSQAKREQILAESGAVYTDLIAVMDKGPDSDEVQSILVRWHDHMRYFYEPNVEVLRGLGQGYNSHPDFIVNFQKLHPDLPGFLEAAISIYCDRIEEGNRMKR